jgi:hypothetical protein
MLGLYIGSVFSAAMNLRVAAENRTAGPHITVGSTMMWKMLSITFSKKMIAMNWHSLASAGWEFDLKYLESMVMFNLPISKAVTISVPALISCSHSSR